jgi:hypothetical protein
LKAINKGGNYMSKKRYENAEIEIIKYDIKDNLLGSGNQPATGQPLPPTSGGNPGGDKDEGGIF